MILLRLLFGHLRMQSIPAVSSSFTHLISVSQLTEILSNDNLIILDASIPPVGGAEKPSKCWPNTAIKATKRFELAKHFSDTTNPLPYTFPSEQQFNQQAQQLGINQDSQIVIYDDLGVFSSARAWWMFKAMGHTNVAVLDGGLPRWMSDNQATITVNNEIQSTSPVGNFMGKNNDHYFCDRFAVKNALEQDNKKVFDARGQARFSGAEQEPRAGMRSGHMPGAVNLPYKSILAEGCFLPVEQLQLLYRALVEKEQALVMSCGSGITACILALGAELCGYKNITVYDGSWSEWGKLADFPVVIGDK